MPKECLFPFYTHTLFGVWEELSPSLFSHPLFLFFWVHHEICNQETLYSFLFCFQLRTESGLDSTGPDQVLESCSSTFQLKRPHREKMERSGPWFEPDTPSLFIPYSPPSFGEDVLVRRTDVVGG